MLLSRPPKAPYTPFRLACLNRISIAVSSSRISWNYTKQFNARFGMNRLRQVTKSLFTKGLRKMLRIPRECCKVLWKLFWNRLSLRLFKLKSTQACIIPQKLRNSSWSSGQATKSTLRALSAFSNVLPTELVKSRIYMEKLQFLTTAARLSL